MRVIRHPGFYCLLLGIFFLAACSSNNITSDDSLKKYFDEYHVTGTFGMFDNGQAQFTIYNLRRFTDSAYLPASTFKIVNSLIGLQTGVISGEKMVIPWDGVVRSNAEWNKDLTMEQAFKLSAVPYYQEVARRIGKDTMQHWLDSLGYGSKYNRAVIKNDLDSFWLDNNIKITADEQLGLAKKLYFEQLPFQKRVQTVVKNVMVQEKNSNYTLAYKTGWGYKEDGKSIGWIVGWEEENRHPYFFVLQIEGPHDMDMVTARLAILKNILSQYGFFKGQR
ncbi:penicillin-binding transpeptidase domain-containing protein [Parafilimonas terrae]|uniref:Beta-lactamase n=1 Tax=Parafilimonas terrae TaxID=1465490 RepID=A0A1I5RPH4_9BACT|nr:penicillin-binding transpeptidase domain-containing protein [Parafilimonas terrae]SFP60418.1 beta-lactamase class D [Parafilimonas terrae]